MAKFRKKPVVVEAVRWVGDNFVEVDRFVTVPHNTYPMEGLVVIPSGDKPQCIVEIGEWIIKGVKGELYACPDDIFQLTYEAAE